MDSQLIFDDCLDAMKKIPNGSVDMILADLPYGTTACKWDTIIPFEPLWEQLERICKNNAAMVFTASQPFTTKLISSNMERFKYELIWEKDKGSNPLLANKMPLKSHENILVFYNKLPVYNPQYEFGKPYVKKQGKCTFGEVVNGGPKPSDKICDGRRYPKSIIRIPREMHRDKENHHPTQKPIALMEYLIKTYTNEGDLVLDPTMGSGTTCLAAKNLKRDFIGIEKEQKYFDMAYRRIYD